MQNLFFFIKVKCFEYTWQKRQLQEKSQAEKNYQSLLEKQSKKNLYRNSSNEEKQRQAIGSHNLYIIFIRPTTVTESQIANLIANLKRQDRDIFESCIDSKNCQKNISFNYLSYFFSEEIKKYSRKTISLNIKIVDKVYVVSDLNQVGDFAYFWGKDEFETTKLEDTFENVLKENGLKLNDDDLVAFLYFDNSFETKSEADQTRFYEYKKFRSFANELKERTYVNVYDFSPFFSEKIVTIVTHELLHLFGAVDKYKEEGDSICSEKGRGDPDKTPIFPQTTGDIMCLHIEYSKGKFKKGSLVDNSLVINRFTAEEIGWKK